MHAADLLGYSARALFGHRVRAVLSLLGVTIGVASVIVLTALGEGARLYVTGEFASLGTNVLILLPGKVETTGMAPIMGGVPNDLTMKDVEALKRQVLRVRRVAPVALGEASVRFRDKSRRVSSAQPKATINNRSQAKQS